MYTSSISVDQVIDALIVVLQPFMQGGQIVRGQVNRVALPPAPCAVLTELRQVDLSVPAFEYQPLVNTATIDGPKRIDVQIDFYGEISSELCNVAKMTLRSAYGFEKFPSNIKPLYTDDGIQGPLISGEQQYVGRWTLTVFMQYNPIVTVPQDFSDSGSVNELIPADIFYR